MRYDPSKRFECCQKCRVKRRLPATYFVGHGGPARCPLCGVEYTYENGRSTWSGGEPAPLPDPIEPIQTSWYPENGPPDIYEKINEVIARLNMVCERLGLVWKAEPDNDGKETKDAVP